MIRSSDSRFDLVAALAGLGLIGLVAGGCDSGSKDASLYRQLVGTWTIDRVSLEGSPPRSLEQTVRLAFSPDSTDDRTYRLTRIAPDDTVAVSGRAQLVDNRLLMTGGFSLEWRVNFDQPDDLSDSVRFQLLSARDEEVRSFLRALGVGGTTQALSIDLVRER